MYSKKKKIVLGIILVIVSFMITIILQFVAVKPEQKLHHHVPSGASLVLKVNNNNLIRRFFFDLIYKGKLTTKDIKQLNYRTNDVETPKTGIAINKDIIAFYEDWKDYDIVGFIFEVDKPAVFGNFLKEETNFIKAYNDGVGSIIIIPESLNEDQRQLLEFYARDLVVKNTNPNPTRIALSNSSVSSLFHLFFEGSSAGLTQNINLEVFVSENKILVEGVGLTNPLMYSSEMKHHFLKQPATEEYLELNIGRLPDTLDHYLNKVLKNVSVELPEIASQQIQLYGFKILNIKGNMFVLPEFDGVFRFNENITLNNEIQAFNHYAFKPGIDSYEVEDVTYHYKQIDSNEIYVGLNSTPAFIEKEGDVLFSISGKPESALNFKGTGIIAKIAQLVPPVQHSKHLLSSLDHFEITTEHIAADSIKVNGSMIFPEDNVASIELLKFLLKF